MKKIVVLQPQFLPWYGVFEQIRLSDIFVHYDDVQFPLGRSFTNRVQIKTRQGIQWLSAPVSRNGIKQINETNYDIEQKWKEQHKRKLLTEYHSAKYFADLENLIEKIYQFPSNNVADFNIFALETISNHLELNTQFLKSSELGIQGKSSERLLNIVQELGGEVYVTGKGAENYLNYDIFEAKNVMVEFMEYNIVPYQQLYDGFTQYVSILDMIANVGQGASKLFNSKSVYWRNYINESN